MGGTFDPIHFGHLILAEQARERFALDQVLFVTAADPPHKSGKVETPAQERHQMVCRALHDNGVFVPSTVELDRPGPSYTIDTIRQLRETLGDGTRIYLLLGADEARDLMSWRDPYGIQELATIVVANRPGCPIGEVMSSLPDDLASRIEPLEMPGVDISSSDLRSRIRAGRSIRYLTPEPVKSYIMSRDLYRGNR